MPVYAQVADLVGRFGQQEIIELTDRASPPSGGLDAAVAERALADADAEIDVYLAGTYELPLPSVPPVLTRIACDIARYRLWDDRAPEEVRARYEDARRVLEAIAAGKVTLGPANGPSGVQYFAPSRIMRDLSY
jgi:phage gp36-like protein